MKVLYLSAGDVARACGGGKVLLVLGDAHLVLQEDGLSGGLGDGKLVEGAHVEIFVSCKSGREELWQFEWAG